MTTHIDHQIIEHNGKPLFVIVPYEEYKKLTEDKHIESEDKEVTFPHEVVEKSIIEDKGLIRAWREYKNISQEEMANRMGITQAAYSQMEKPKARLRIKTLEKIAAALEVDIEQLKI